VVVFSVRNMLECGGWKALMVLAWRGAMLTGTSHGGAKGSGR